MLLIISFLDKCAFVFLYKIQEKSDYRNVSGNTKYLASPYN